MKILLKVALLLQLLSCVSQVSAAHYYRNVTITGTGIYGSGANSVLFVDFSGSKTDMTACATTQRLAISSTAPQYKEMVSIAFIAYVKQDSKVDILVNESCVHWSNAEDMLGIKMGTIPW